jgi:ferritin-like protein
MDIADEIVVSEGLAPSSERDLLEKIAAALDAERAAVVAWIRIEESHYPVGHAPLNTADAIERGEHRREED